MEVIVHQVDAGETSQKAFPERRGRLRIGSSMRCFPALLAGLSISASSALASDGVDYLRDVKPILSEHCYSCHGAQKQESGLRLDTVAAARRGGNTGPAIVPGK